MWFCICLMYSCCCVALPYLVYITTLSNTRTCKPSSQHLPGRNSYHKHLRAFAAAFDNTRTCEPSPRHLPRQKPYHKHLQTITAAFAKTKTFTMLQAPANHHRGICQDKNLTQAFASNHRGICQDKHLATSTREPSPRHLPRQKPYHKHLLTITGTFAKTQAPANHHLGNCQDENLTRICQHKLLRTIAGAFAKTKTSCHKCLRAITAAIAKTKTLLQASAPHHRDICQDKNLTHRHLRQKPYQKHPRNITAAVAKAKTLPQASANHHRGN